MVHIVSVNAFEEQFKKFEQEQLFDQQDYTSGFADRCTQGVSDIFQTMSGQYQALLRGQRIGLQQAPDYEKTARDLTQFVRGTFDRTAAEFDRKLTKKRLLKADSRRAVWEHRREQLKGLVKTVVKNIELLSQATGDELGKGLKKTLPERVKIIQGHIKALNKNDTSICPLEGNKEEVSAKIAAEKERWTAQIGQINEMRAYKKELEEYAKAANFYCRPDHPRTFPLRNSYEKFSEEKGELEWALAGSESFGNTLADTFRDRLHSLKQLKDKYTPEKIAMIREGRIDLAELKRDYDQIVLLVFYLRQMMDVPWEDHPLGIVSGRFQDFFLEAPALCDAVSRNLAAHMAIALRGRLKQRENEVDRNLLINRVPEPKKTFFQKLCSAVAAFFSWIASLFRKD